MLSYCLATSSDQRLAVWNDSPEREDSRGRKLDEKLESLDLAEIEALIAQNSENINAVNDNGDTLLHLSIKQEKFNVTEKLIEANHMRRNLQNKEKETPLSLLYQLRIERILDKNFFQTLWYWISPHGRKDRKKIDDLISLFIGGMCIVNVTTVEEQIENLKRLKGLKGWIHKHLTRGLMKKFVFFSLFNTNLDLDSVTIDQWIKRALGLGSIKILKYIFDNGINGNLRKEEEYWKDISINLTKEKQYEFFETAFESNNWEMLDYLIKHEVGYYSLDSSKENFIHRAVQEQNMKMVTYLVKKGFNIMLRDKNGENVFHKAVRSENLEIITYLIENGVDVNQRGTSKSAIEYAIESENLDVLRCILTHAKNLEFNLIYNGGEIRSNLLYEAVKKNNLEMVQLFVEYGSDVNFHSLHAFLLRDAIVLGNLDIVRYLIEHKAKFYGEGSDESALLVAYSSKRWDIFKYLLEKGENINDMRDDFQWTHFSTNSDIEERLDIMKYFLEKGIDINVEDENGESILYGAIAIGDWDFIESCINKGFKFDDKNKDGLTVIDNIFKFARLDVMKSLIVKYHINLNMEREFLFHQAIEQENIPLLKDLIEESPMEIEGESLSYRKLLNDAIELKKRTVIDYFIKEFNDLPHSQHPVAQILFDLVIERRDWDLLHYIIENSADVNRVEFQQSIFDRVVPSKNLEMVEYLLSNGAKVTQKSLDDAIQTGHLDIVKKIVANVGLAKGVDFNIVRRYEKNVDGFSHFEEDEQEDKESIERTPKKKTFDHRDRRRVFNEKIYNGTLYHLALRTGNLEVVKYLVGQGAQMNNVESEGKTLYHWANLAVDSEHLNYFINNGADIHLIDTDGNTALHCVCRLKNVDNVAMVQYFVGQKLDINAINEFEETPLEIASQTGNLEVVKYLVENGADVTKGYCLHRAIESENLDLVKYLVENSADGTKTNPHNDFETLIDLAIGIKNINIVKYFVGRGMKINPLFGFQTSLDIVKYLIENEHMNLNEVNEEGKTPLHVAIESGEIDIVKYLIKEQHMNPTEVNKEGKTPLHVAIRTGGRDIIQYFVEELKVNINHIEEKTKGLYRESYLHFVYKKKDYQLFRYFLEQGSKWDFKGNSDDTVLKLVQEDEDQKALNILNEFIQQRQTQTAA